MNKVIIVGGGAAGMMAAISASKEGKKACILEKNEKLGKKLFITGKGRCNITNACPADEFLTHVVTNPRFLYSTFSQFNNEDMMDYLEEIGLPIKTERGQRVFPQSDRSSDVIDALKKQCKKGGVQIYYHTEVKELLFDEEKENCVGVLLSDGKKMMGDSVILACGGFSYASTGSNGSGYTLAKQAGHKIKSIEPSLVPFEMKEMWCKDLMGLTLKNIGVRIKAKKKTVYEGFGEFLFTHFGVSGPLVLTASTCLGKYQKELEAGELKLILDLKASLTPEQLDKRFLREFDTYRNKNISNVMERLLPKKMIPVFLEEAQIPEDKKLVIYTSHKEDVYEPIIKEFEERTGIFVELKAGDTIALFDELQQDEPGTFDVMFGGGIESFEECRDYFQPYTVSEAERIQEQYRAEEDVYTPFSVLPTVFIYNNKLVYPVAAPKTWAELQTDRWEGKIAFADPTKSGSSYTALCTMLQVLGEDEETILRNFCDTLDGNVSASSGEVLEEVNAGTRLVGITSEGMARQKILEGEDITIIYPQDGTSAIPDATAIVKGCRHPENAKAFLEFTVSTDVQRLVEEKFFRRTVRNDMDEYAIQEKNKLKAIDYDIQWAAREKENILTAWERLQEENR